MPEITETELRKQIEKSSFGNLYFLYGEEKYLVKAWAQKLIAKAAGNAFPDFNLQRFSGDAAVDQLAAAAEALPFMAERKCVAVSDLNVEDMSAKELSKLDELLATLPESTVLVIYQPTLVFEARKSAAWRKFLTAVNRQGSSVLLKYRADAELEKLLCTLADKRLCALSRQDAAYLVSLCGRELQTLYNEMEKLCAYVGQGEITRQVIDRVAVKNMETTVFILSKALIAGEYDKAYGLLDLLFYQNEEPIAVLAALSASYLDMYRVRAAVQSGQSSMEPAKYFPYKGKEFRLKNAERDAKRLSTDMLRRSLDVLLETDLSLKSSRANSRVLMEELIAKLLLIAERERIS